MLVRYDPFRELDRMTDEFLGSGSRRTQFMPLDAVRRGHTVELRFDLPGISPDVLDLTVERNVLTVRAERTWTPQEGDEVLAHERPHGTVTRQVMLGESLDAERLEAQYEHGVLVVTIPVADEAKPRKVEIQTGGREAIEVGSEA